MTSKAPIDPFHVTLNIATSSQFDRQKTRHSAKPFVLYIDIYGNKMSQSASLEVDETAVSSQFFETNIEPTIPGSPASPVSPKAKASIANLEDDSPASERHLEHDRQHQHIAHTSSVSNPALAPSQPPWNLQRRGSQVFDPMELPLMPPIPDLRFEQSYLNSIANASSWKAIAWITLRDQVRFLYFHSLP